MHIIGLQFSLGGYFVVVAKEMLMAILNTVHLTLFSINSVAFIASLCTMQCVLRTHVSWKSGNVGNDYVTLCKQSNIA